MIRIAKQFDLSRLFVCAACIGLFLLGIETHEGKPHGSLFLLPLCLAWLGRDPRAMKAAIVGALLVLLLVWILAEFSLSKASLLQWCTTAFLIVFLGGALLESQRLNRDAKMRAIRDSSAEGGDTASKASATNAARGVKRLPKDRSLSARTLQSLLNSIEGAALLFDEDMRLILANQEGEALVAFSRPGAEIAHAAEFLPEPVLDLLYSANEAGGQETAAAAAPGDCQWSIAGTGTKHQRVAHTSRQQHLR